MHIKKMWSMNIICGYHAAIGKLHACETEVKNAVGTYCGSKDRWFIGHSPESHVGIKDEAISCEIACYLCCETMCTKKNADCNDYNIRC